MPKLRKVDGAWRNVGARYRKVNGKWCRVIDSYRKVNGMWVKIFGHTFIAPYIKSSDPKLDVGAYYDEEDKAWEAYINGIPTAGTVQVGIQIQNIPANSTIRVRIAKADMLDNLSGVGFYSNGKRLSGHGLSNTAVYFTEDNVSNEFIILLEKNVDSDIVLTNFALYEVRINGSIMPLI